MSVLYWNCCGGLASKIDTVKQIISVRKPMAFFVAESEIKKEVHSIKWFEIEGYEIVLSKTYTKLGKSRLMGYLSLNYSFKIRDDLIKDDQLELIAVDFDKTRVVAVYRPFANLDRSRKDALECLLHGLGKIDDHDYLMAIVGDFNINLNIRTPELQQITKFMDDLSYFQLIKENTWRRVVTIDNIKELRTSRLDHVYTNDETKVEALVEDQWSSDHNVISIRIRRTYNKVERHKTKTRDWRKYNSVAASFVAGRKLDRIYTPNSSATVLNDQISKALILTQDELCP